MRSVWRVESTAALAEIEMALGAAILGSVGIYFASPVAGMLAGIAVFVLIYRLRYKRF